MEVHLITIHRCSRLARVPDKMSIEIHAVLCSPLLLPHPVTFVHLSPAKIGRRIVSDRISDRASECRHNSRRSRDQNDLQFLNRRDSTGWSPRCYSSSFPCSAILHFGVLVSLNFHRCCQRVPRSWICGSRRRFLEVDSSWIFSVNVVFSLAFPCHFFGMWVMETIKLVGAIETFWRLRIGDRLMECPWRQQLTRLSLIDKIYFCSLVF